MSKDAYTTLLGLLMVAMINCKNRESAYFEELAKARIELEELYNVQSKDIQGT